jgi:hypothetical protein
MSEELVKRLRTTAGNPAICKAAATTIERLTRERDAAQVMDRLQGARAARAARAALPPKTGTPTLDASAGHTVGDPTGHASLARLTVRVSPADGGE